MAKRSIVHFEIPAQDRAKSAKFYADLFGWEVEHLDDPAPYTVVRSGSLGGGLADVGEQYQVGDVILYIDSEDLEADLTRIEAAGGKALSPAIDVGEMGRMVFFADVSGNRLALWQDKNAGG